MTMRDIAKLAGVSTATVSKVINDKSEDISDETRSKILSIIDEHNYVPYKKQVERANKNVSVIALFVTDVSDIFSAELLRGVEDYLYQREFNVIICNTDGDSKKEQQYIHLLEKQNIRGIIRYPIPEEDNRTMTNLNDDEIYSVILDDNKSPDAMKASFNNKEGGRIATQHLIDHGHQRIGYIGQKIQKPYMLERYEGYRQALEQNRIELDASIVYHGDFEKLNERRKCGYYGAKYLISQKVTAIFCCDDHAAIGVYHAAQEAGLRIPQDLSVMGFDDTMFCEVLQPYLSSIRQSAYEIGKNSAKLLYAKINHLPIENQTIQVQPTLVERSSVMPPNAAWLEGQDVTVIVGEIRADIEIQTEGPDESSTQKARGMEISPGGWGVRTALARMDLGEEVYLVGCLGNDTNGRNIFRALSKTGLKLDGVVFEQSSPTGMALITVSDGEKPSRVLVPGANQALDGQHLRDAEWIFYRATRCLVDPSLSEPTRATVEQLCKKARMPLEPAQPSY